MTVSAVQKRGFRQRYNEVLLRETLLRLFRALDFLHTGADVVHTGMLGESGRNARHRRYSRFSVGTMLISDADIKATNIMLTIDDESMLADFEKAEQDEPSLRKMIDADRTIHTSRELRLPKAGLWGEPVLCDFGQARIGRAYRGDIQPAIYKAPEVLFEMEWNHKVDIWNVGVMVSTALPPPEALATSHLWIMSESGPICHRSGTFFENKHMFNALDEDQQYSPSHHVAEMVAYLGLPPLEFVQRSEATRNVFDEHGKSYYLVIFPSPRPSRTPEGVINIDLDLGKWLGAGGVKIPPISFWESEENLSGKTREGFFRFIRSMLRWCPEERKSARELLDDPWLNEMSEV
jgi:serine/threonine-protein kinase SRPK3